MTAVLTDYAELRSERERHGSSGSWPELTTFLHRPDGAARAATLQIHQLVTDLVAECTAGGEVRADPPAGELAHYCLHALDAASQMTSRAAVERLVELVLSAIRTSTDGA